MDSARLSRYTAAYAHLGNITPIPADCGRLCGAKCCSGSDDSGMILFPGEREFLSATSFLKIEKRDMHGVAVDFAVCSGRCRRILRPLSCRVFPLAPFWDGEKLEILPDPRARFICPLLEATSCISEEFVRAAKAAFSVLTEDAEISQMLIAYTAMLREYADFTG